jgi:hypothetical protein
MQCHRETIRLKEGFKKREARLTNEQSDAAIEAKLRFLKSRFLRITSVTRNRIKVMEADKNPKPKTLRAIEARKTLLYKYEEAYARQQALARAGIRVDNIEDMVQE